MIDRESVMQAMKDSLRNQHCGFIEGIGNVYAVSEETINDTLELLKEQNCCENCAIAIEDMQPVVRCRDCKYCGSEIMDGFKFAKCELKHNWLPQADWFCADGERK